MPRVALAFAILLGLTAQPVTLEAQQDVVGSWEMSIETPRGAMTQTFEFTQDGDVLSGTVTGPRGSTELQNVQFADGVLTFEVLREFRGNSMTQSFSATIEGDEMTGTMSGGRGGEREFTAVRC